VTETVSSHVHATYTHESSMAVLSNDRCPFSCIRDPQLCMLDLDGN